MALFGIFRKRRSLSGGKLANKGTYKKVEYQPTVIFKPHAARRSNPVVKTPLQRQGRFVTFKRIALGILALGLITLIVYGFYQLLRNPYFAVSKFTVLGNKTVTDNQMDTVLAKYQDRNIFLVNTMDVENTIAKAYPIFNGVEVHKFFPDMLFIKISEREPKLIYVNLSGAYLVDSKGQVLNQISATPNDLLPEQVDIYRGYGDPNGALVRDRLLTEFKASQQIGTKTEAEQEQIVSVGFNFDQIPLSQKQQVLAELQSEAGRIIANYLAQNDQAVDQSDYAAYPRVDVLEVKAYKETDIVALDRLSMTLEVTGLFASHNIPVTRIVWEGELLVNVTLEGNRTVIFGLNRKTSDQFEDYLLVVNQLRKEGHDYKKIDVSSSKVSVMR